MGMTPQHFHTFPTPCAILPPLTQICFAFFLVVCRGLWKAVWWVVLGVHVAWGVGYVVGGCNVQCTCYIEHGRCGLSCLYAETVANWVHEQCWVFMVCMVCVVYGRVSNLKYESVRWFQNSSFHIANPGKKETTDRSGSHAFSFRIGALFPEVLSSKNGTWPNI